VSKTSNANTITHYVQASLKTVRRVARDLEALYPSAQVSARTLALVSPIGRDLKGLKVLSRGLNALEEAGIEVVAAHQTPRGVDVQFVIAAEAMEAGITALHRWLIEGRTPVAQVDKAA
jgi:aspartate kinase